MNAAPLLPIAQTTLLIAGPRAGKTELLLRWLEESQSPTLYLGITPEDESPGFLLQRFFANWPAIRERFEALQAGLEGASWGGVLGLAIAQAHPDLCLLLDDLHLTEPMANSGEWLALLRHFPASGTLVVASRHQIPDLNRPALRVWGSDDLGWTERPTLQDLFAMPASLRSKAIVMHIIGEAVPSQDGEELVRRGVAVLDPDGLHRLRPAWQAAVLPATRSRSIEPAVWDEVAAELEGFIHRHLGTTQELLIPRILERIPPEIRQRSPFLLRVEGDLLFDEGLDEAAQETYQRVLLLSPDPRVANEVRVRLLPFAARDPAQAGFAELMAALEAHAPLPPRVEVQLRYWRAFVLWLQGSDLEAFRTAMERVLAVPPSGEREVLSFHIQALSGLAASHDEHEAAVEASEYARRLLNLCEANGFHRQLLTAYCQRLSCMLTIGSTSIESLVGVPEVAFDGAEPHALSHYLICFGEWAHLVGAHRFALDLLSLVLAYSVGHRLTYRILQAKFWILHTLLEAGSFERARTLYEELRGTPAYQNFDDMLPTLLAWGLIRHGRLDEAEEALREAAGDSVRKHLYHLWLRDLRGEEGVREEAMSFLQGPERARILTHDRDAAVHFGLCEAPTFYHLSAFGAAGFTRVGSPAPRWPRKRALSLLAQLTLHPDGMPAADLVKRLNRDSEAQDPLAALHAHAYHLRHALNSVGAGDLLDSVRGMYRFDWAKVAFSELHLFDHLYQKAQALEGHGQMDTAALFYRMAIMLVQGPLFANLTDEALEAPRREYATRTEYARAFVETYAPGFMTIETLPTI